MATLKKRVNISLSPDLEKMLFRVAKRDNLPQATKAAHLLEFALEIEEDVALDKIAGERDHKKTRFLTHKQVWS